MSNVFFTDYRYLTIAVIAAVLLFTMLIYRHGTGHGVGHFLNVHEGKMLLFLRTQYFDDAAKAHKASAPA